MNDTVITEYTSSITLFKEVNIALVSENACLLTWPEKIDAKQHNQIILCEQKIQECLHEKIIDIVVSYNSLMIYYDFMALTSDSLMHEVSQIINTIYQPQPNENNSLANNNTSSKIIDIPVYFGDDVAWDLDEITESLNLTKQEFIALYTQQTYQAYALGFTPGFCYLGSLNKQLQLPRRATPRLKIPSGAVAIAEEQTAIYPNESPGGWNIIGRTPLPLYQISNEAFTPAISVGDSVKFTEISQQEFARLTLKYSQKSKGDNNE